jgi:hypothetical protein
MAVNRVKACLYRDSCRRPEGPVGMRKVGGAAARQINMIPAAGHAERTVNGSVISIGGETMVMQDNVTKRGARTVVRLSATGERQKDRPR